MRSERISYMIYGVCLRLPKTTNYIITKADNLDEEPSVRHFFSKQKSGKSSLQTLKDSSSVSLQIFSETLIFYSLNSSHLCKPIIQHGSNNACVLVSSDLKLGPSSENHETKETAWAYIWPWTNRHRSLKLMFFLQQWGLFNSCTAISKMF